MKAAFRELAKLVAWIASAAMAAALFALAGLCRGVFLYVNGQCPGCGSKQWVLLVPPLIAASLNKEDR